MDKPQDKNPPGTTTSPHSPYRSIQQLYQFQSLNSTPPATTNNRQAKDTQQSSSNHSLKLKDYLRLASINNRGSSGAKSRKKSVSAHRNEGQGQSQIQGQGRDSGLNTEKSLEILKEELRLDLKTCMDKIGELITKVEKSSPKLKTENRLGLDFDSPQRTPQHSPDKQQIYEELVFLCQLHRTVKQSIMGNIDKANNLVTEYKQKQLFKFSAKAKELMSDDIKKTTTPKKRSSLYVSCWRPHFLENSSA